MFDVETKRDLKNRCLAFIKECPSDIAKNKPYWDKEIDHLVNMFFLYLKEDEDGKRTRDNKKI